MLKMRPMTAGKVKQNREARSQKNKMMRGNMLKCSVEIIGVFLEWFCKCHTIRIYFVIHHDTLIADKHILLGLKVILNKEFLWLYKPWITQDNTASV